MAFASAISPVVMQMAYFLMKNITAAPATKHTTPMIILTSICFTSIQKMYDRELLLLDDCHNSSTRNEAHNTDDNVPQHFLTPPSRHF